MQSPPTEPIHPMMEKLVQFLERLKTWIFGSEQRILLILYIFVVFQILTHFGAHRKLYGDPIHYEELTMIFLGQWTKEAYMTYYEAQGQSGVLMVMAFFKRPVTPFLASLLCRISGLTPANSLSIICSIYSLLIVFFLYRLLLEWGFSQKVVFTTMLLFINSFPTLVLVATTMTDMGGYLFSILLLYLAVHYKKNLENCDWKIYVIFGLVNGIGMLVRETVLFTFAFIIIINVLYPFWDRKIEPKWFPKAFHILLFFAVALIISAMMVLSWYIFGMGLSPFDFQINTIELSVFANQDMIEKILFIGIITFHISYIFFIRGFQQISDRKQMFNLLIYCGIMFVAMFMQFFAIPFSHIPQYRMGFLVFPVFLPVAAEGLHKLADDFSQKPVLNIFPRQIWYLIGILMYMIISFGLSLPYATQSLLDLVNLGNLSDPVIPT